MNTTPRFNRVVIAGGGTAGWMMAALMSKLLGKQLDIKLVESEEIGTVGVGEATIPALHTFHNLLGINEAEFMAATQATFKLGIKFEGWKAPGEDYIHSFGMTGKDHWSAGFQHFWLKGRGEGLAQAYTDYNPETVAAHANRFAHLPRNGLNYAYHLDAGRYAKFLRAMSEAHGVQRIEGKIGAVLMDGPAGRDGPITALQMHDGSRIDGDLFIDCTGFRSMLLGEALGVGYEDWSYWLPCDRAVAVPSESTAPLLPYTRATAHRAGWQWRIPLQHRVGNGHVYASSHVSDDEAAAVLLQHLDGPPLAEPRLIKFRTGMRAQAWRRNVVAIGMSAGFVEPLESTALHLIQMGVAKLIEAFPHRGFDPVEIAEYNRESRERYEYVRDFIVLHYHLNQREDSPFWQACAAMAVPESLRRTLDLYAASGRLPAGSGDLFRAPSWLEVMEGQNLRPQGWLALTELQGVDETAAYLKGVSDTIAACVAVMPEHGEFVRRYCAAPPA